MIEADGFDARTIELLFVDLPAQVPATLEGRTDALVDGIDNRFFPIEAQAHKAVGLCFADLGVDTVGVTIRAHEDRLRGRPDFVRRFGEGTVSARAAADADPDAAVATAAAVEPDFDRESAQ